MSEPTVGSPAPVDANGIRTVQFGTIAWAIGAIALLPFYGRLNEDGHTWWIWVCVAGFGLGCVGLDYLHRRARKLATGLDTPPSAATRPPN